jgi:hypothetical protein
MIADSKEVQEWNLDINLEPDTIEARVLKRPSILMEDKGQNKGPSHQGGAVGTR